MAVRTLGLILYGMQEAARTLGVSYETIRHYVRDGRLKAARVGRSYRIEESELREFLRQGVPPRRRQGAPGKGKAGGRDYPGKLREALALADRLAPVIRRGTRKTVSASETIRAAREERDRRISGGPRGRG